MEAIAAGIDYLVDQGCDIISLSLGGPKVERLKRSIDRAVSRGVFVICAAGNSGYVAGKSTVGCPANLANTIAVANYNKSGELSRSSSRGAEVDIAFPGEDILSTWLNGGYRKLTGTSMATPFAAGLVAELLGQQRKADNEDRKVPKYIRNNADLLEHIKLTAVDKGPTGYDNGWGWGVVDTAKFLASTGAPIEVPEEVKEIDLGVVRIKFPAEIDGQRGWFVYIP
jgi:minor extracellular protease Epr